VFDQGSGYPGLLTVPPHPFGKQGQRRIRDRVIQPVADELAEGFRPAWRDRVLGAWQHPLQPLLRERFHPVAAGLVAVRSEYHLVNGSASVLVRRHGAANLLGEARPLIWRGQLLDAGSPSARFSAPRKNSYIAVSGRLLVVF